MGGSVWQISWKRHNWLGQTNTPLRHNSHRESNIPIQTNEKAECELKIMPIQTNENNRRQNWMGMKYSTDTIIDSVDDREPDS